MRYYYSGNTMSSSLGAQFKSWAERHRLWYTYDYNTLLKAINEAPDVINLKAEYNIDLPTKAAIAQFQGMIATLTGMLMQLLQQVSGIVRPALGNLPAALGNLNIPDIIKISSNMAAPPPPPKSAAAFYYGGRW